MKDYEVIPIIMITTHGHDNPNLAVDVLRSNGTIDYVKKPVPEHWTHDREGFLWVSRLQLLSMEKRFYYSGKATALPIDNDSKYHLDIPQELRATEKSSG